MVLLPKLTDALATGLTIIPAQLIVRLHVQKPRRLEPMEAVLDGRSPEAVSCTRDYCSGAAAFRALKAPKWCFIEDVDGNRRRDFQKT